MISFPPLPEGEQPIWNGENFLIGQRTVRVLSYSSNLEGWNEELTELHEIEASDGQHPIDLASRQRAIASLRASGFPEDGTILEIGCSSGFLLHDLRGEFPIAKIVGADVVLKPLERLGQSLPGVPLLQLDLLECPLPDAQFDAIFAINVLEHIENDRLALKQIMRLLKTGGILILEVPQGPALYDYFDAFLRHFKRYGRRELTAKLKAVASIIDGPRSLGFVVWPAFWFAKMHNRWRFGPNGERAVNIEALVRAQVRQTGKSKLLRAAFTLEAMMQRLGCILPGVRIVATCRKV